MRRVLKVGGSALADAAWTEALATAVAGAAGQLILVHGGGPEITQLAGRLGVAFTWAGGRRVTSPEAMEVTAMVLSGRVNKRLVASLQTAGRDAVGLSGEDGGLLRAGYAEGGRLGRVGVVEEVRVELLNVLLDLEIVPVISPVSRGPEGEPMNVNADDAAAAIAAALGAEELLFLTDVPGVLEAGMPRRELTAGEAAELVACGTATGGMAVKLAAAQAALEVGVRSVRIGGLEMLTEWEAGTRIGVGREVAA